MEVESERETFELIEEVLELAGDLASYKRREGD